MSASAVQMGVFVALTALIGLLTIIQVRRMRVHSDDPLKEQFLAGGGLSWVFVAGSITLTNLSTDQLVGMNGNQMLLLAWWELSAVAGLLMLAFIFLPIYYRNNCTTTTELLEKRYNNKHIRALIGMLFLLGNVFIYLPIMLYTGSLFLISMFGWDTPLIVVAGSLALIGAAYAVFGGLKAVAVSDTISGVGVLGVCLLIVFLALRAIDFDLSQIPAERLTMIGAPDSPIPFATLFTGMLFIQMFYWSTNQTITQRAMAAPNIREAQRGVVVAAGIRFMIVPAIVVIPGVAAFQLYGDIGDAAYGQVVGDLLPSWLSGAFGAMMAAAVLTSFNSVLNSSTTLYVCDLHEAYVDDKANIARLNMVITLLFVVAALVLVPVYSGADSIINLVQQLNGLLSMPILSAFIVGLVFRNVAASAAMAGVVFGVSFYAALTFGAPQVEAFIGGLLGGPFVLPHYIHLMLITLIGCVTFALVFNRLILGRTATLALGKPAPAAP